MTNPARRGSSNFFHPAAVSLTPSAFRPASLYFHIPFCTKKCDYCHFYVIPDHNPHKIQLLKGLTLEWEKQLPLLEGSEIVSIYFGGGTPTLIGPESIKTILDMVRNSVKLLDGEVEITLEANPENITEQEIRSYAEAGINRVSIGIQTLDNQLLKTLGRLHDASKATDSVLMTASAGIQNISIDLMYDLPGQTLPMWETTLNRVSELPISHLSLYNLTIEPHTVYFKNRKSLKKIQPDPETSLQMYEMAVSLLEGNQLLQYEISAFAREGRYSRHNTGYWTARPFLGFGPSAFSYWKGSRFRNASNLSKYCRALDEGKTAIDFEETLDPPAKSRELLAIQIRLLSGVDLDLFQQVHGSLPKDTLAVLKKLEAEGYLHKEGAVIRLTGKGVIFYDTVAIELV